MRKCPKCSSQYNDDPKICRVCGAILAPAVKADKAGDERKEASVAEEPQPEEQEPADEEPDAKVPARTGLGEWMCLQCKSPVPNTFEVCWKCGANRDGVADPEFDKTPPKESSNDAPDCAEERSAAAPLRQCPNCGSLKIIPNNKLCDRAEVFAFTLKVMIDGNPDAFLLKDRKYAQLIADICGDCGHVGLRVENPRELYEHSQRFRE